MEPELRRKLAWLIAIRVVISTLLLGSAILVQITRAGSLPVDPFFFLIGLTYALTLVYALTLPLRRSAPLAHRSPAGRRRARSSRRSSTSPAASRATSRRSTCCRSSPPACCSSAAAACCVAILSTVLYAGLVLGAVPRRLPGCSSDPWLTAHSVALPAGRLAQFTVALNVFGFFAVALAGRVARRAPAVRRRAARSEASTRAGRPAGVQPARHRQPHERPGDDGHAPDAS